MAYRTRSIKCRNCDASIVLPVPVPYGTNLHPPVSNTDAERIALICLRCENVCEYILSEYPAQFHDEGLDPFLDPDGLCLIAILPQCDAKNCGLPLTVLAVQQTMPNPALALAPSLSTGSWTYHEILCSSGRHTFVPPQGSTLWAQNK